MKHSFILLALSSLLVSCGTVSKVESPAGATAAPVARAYSRVLVKDFTPAAKDETSTGTGAAKMFADKIASAISAAKPGAKVSRSGSADASTLVISGEVTRFAEGNAALRLMVGMGAGSSYFDANVRLTDASGKRLSEIKVDKNSWALGGIMAASQNAFTFMDAGAKKTAEEAVLHLK